MNKDDAMKPRKRGRPQKKIPKIEASPERIARAMFSAVRQPDPSLRRKKALAS